MERSRQTCDRVKPGINFITVGKGNHSFGCLFVFTKRAANDGHIYTMSKNEEVRTTGCPQYFRKNSN